MNKQIILTLIFASFSAFAHAQDVLYKKNGTTENVKILEVSETKITYKKWDNTDGPNFIIHPDEVKKIMYENGTEDNFRNGKTVTINKNTNTDLPVNERKNIIAISPFFMTNTGPIGIGASYERIVGSKGIIGLILPAGVSFYSNYFGGFNASNDRKSTVFYAFPGAKFYIPKQDNSKGIFSIGLSVPIAAGSVQESGWFFDPNTQTQTYDTRTNQLFTMGIMLMNSINIFPTDHLYLSIDFGIGYPYFVSESLDRKAINYVATPFTNGAPLVNGGVKIGYRF